MHAEIRTSTSRSGLGRGSAVTMSAVPGAWPAERPQEVRIFGCCLSSQRVIHFKTSDPKILSAAARMWRGSRDAGHSLCLSCRRHAAGASPFWKRGESCCGDHHQGGNQASCGFDFAVSSSRPIPDPSFASFESGDNSWRRQQQARRHCQARLGIDTGHRAMVRGPASVLASNPR